MSPEGGHGQPPRLVIRRDRDSPPHKTGNRAKHGHVSTCPYMHTYACTPIYIDGVSQQFSNLGGERLFHFAALASDRLAGVRALSGQHAIGGGID